MSQMPEGSNGADRFDFVIVDAEHGPSSIETLEAQVRAADTVNLPVVVRIAENTPQNILRHLDTGVLGAQLIDIGIALGRTDDRRNQR